MEKPTKVEVGQRWRGPYDGPKGDAIVAVLRSGVCNEHPEIPHVHWSSGGWDQIHRFEPKCDPRLTYLGGPQPSPEVPPAPAPGQTWVDKSREPINGGRPFVLDRPEGEGWIHGGAWTCDEWFTNGHLTFVSHPTTPLVPLEGKEPDLADWTPKAYKLAAAPQGKPHDWSNPYLVSLGVRLCVDCGMVQAAGGTSCTPDAGWREAHEGAISDAQRAADDAMASGAHWIQTRKGTQAAQPEGRFQSHLIGAGLGVWNMRAPDGK